MVVGFVFLSATGGEADFISGAGFVGALSVVRD